MEDQFASRSDTRAPWSVIVATLHLACLTGCEVKPSNLIPEIHTGLTSNQSCTWKEGIIHCWGFAPWPRQWPSWKHYLVVAVEQCASSPHAVQRKAVQAFPAFFDHWTHPLWRLIQSITQCPLSDCIWLLHRSHNKKWKDIWCMESITFSVLRDEVLQGRTRLCFSTAL